MNDRKLLRVKLLAILIACLMLSISPVQAQPRRGARQLTRDRVAPHWSNDGNRFWYRNDLGQGQKEFVLVDAERGVRELAFDHAEVAKAIGNNSNAEAVTIDHLEFTSNKDVLMLHGVNPDQRWAWNRVSQKTVAVDSVTAEVRAEDPAGDSSRAARTGAETEITFDNRMSSSVEIFWLDGDGGKRSYGKISPGERRNQHTFGGHRWQMVNEKGDSLGEVIANDTPRLITIDGRVITESRPRRRPRTGGRTRSGNDNSPDGKWRAEIKDFNVVIRSNESNDEIALTSDGREGNAYNNLSWSPDSQSLAVWRTEKAERLEVHLVRSSPPGGVSSDTGIAPLRFARRQIFQT